MSTTASALSGAARDVRAAWRPRSSLAAAVIAATALGPFVLSSTHVEDVAGALYLAGAAVALALCVGVAGLPLLCQGAFMAVGAFTGAQLGGHGLPPLLTALAGAAAAACAGVVVGGAFVRLPRALFAAATFACSWLALLALRAFPRLSGGSEGLILGGGPSVATHYELALGLLVAVGLLFTALARGSFGLRLAAAREHRAAARALGVPVERLRIVVVAATAAVAGLAGALLSQLAAVADAGAYDTFLSFRLFVAVLIGGALTAFGPPAGIAVLALLSFLADAVGRLEHTSATRSHPLLTAALLLAVLSLGLEGALKPGRARRRLGGGALPRARARMLSVRGAEKRFAEVAALAGLDLELAPGTITALVGPNGSGKTTALRVVAGTVTPDRGDVLLDGEKLGAARVAFGVARTLQSTAVFGPLTAVEHLLVGIVARRCYSGFWRVLLATPKSRAEDGVAATEAQALLDRFGLAHLAETTADRMTVLERRILMLAAAYATGASVLLVDEPTAGASRPEAARIAALLRELGEQGLALLVVEHDLHVVRAIADRVVALDAGVVVASGTADEVGAHPRVREAYLGRSTI